MMISCTLIVIANNGAKRETVFVSILAFDTLIVTHLNNSYVLKIDTNTNRLFRLALVVFNPEVRKFLGLRMPWHRESTATSGSSNRQLNF
uniref:Secreted protein n=1 Tax=Steinernema glaseri TaxID=37863 RepID=A0A1I7Z9E9_9BILA